MRVLVSRRVGVLGALVVAGVVATASPAFALPSFGTAPVSGVGFGGVGPGKQVTIQSVRVGHHSGFDRVVISSTNGLPSYTVGYTSQVTNDPRGTVVPLLGSAFLEVTLRGTAWMTSPSPQPTITPGFPALRQLKGAGEFEAVAHYGIGQTTKAGFRVFTLTGPNRIVIDLAAPSGAAAPPSTGTKSSSESAAGGLANTGFPTVQVAWLGLGLLIAGGAAVALSRRRRATT